ncbi:hypothetical protein SDC9_65360 [bioreactor metagenome]|uniref:Uncharacterized protein n=1 Tax=bioreactor metagenome TaxID=1076179 RepID=A0A644XRS8_9ZZZZ
MEGEKAGSHGEGDHGEPGEVACGGERAGSFPREMIDDDAGPPLEDHCRQHGGHVHGAEDGSPAAGGRDGRYGGQGEHPPHPRGHPHGEGGQASHPHGTAPARRRKQQKPAQRVGRADLPYDSRQSGGGDEYAAGEDGAQHHPHADQGTPEPGGTRRGIEGRGKPRHAPQTLEGEQGGGRNGPEGLESPDAAVFHYKEHRLPDAGKDGEETPGFLSFGGKADRVARGPAGKDQRHGEGDGREQGEGARHAEGVNGEAEGSHGHDGPEARQSQVDGRVKTVPLRREGEGLEYEDGGVHGGDAESGEKPPCPQGEGCSHEGEQQAGRRREEQSRCHHPHRSVPVVEYARDGLEESVGVEVDARDEAHQRRAHAEALSFHGQHHRCGDAEEDGQEEGAHQEKKEGERRIGNQAANGAF